MTITSILFVYYYNQKDSKSHDRVTFIAVSINYCGLLKNVVVHNILKLPIQSLLVAEYSDGWFLILGLYT